MLSTLPTYVIHYTPLTERRKNIEKFFSSEFFNLKFIEDYDKEKIGNGHPNSQYIRNKNLFKEKTRLWKSDAIEEYKLFEGEISCLLKHVEALRIISESKEEIALIVEDDVLPVKRNFEKKLKKILKKRVDWKIIFIGQGAGKKYLVKKVGFFNRNLKRGLIKVDHPGSNCTEAILIKKPFAISLLKELENFNLPYDWELAHILFKLNEEPYWFLPQIFKQGSRSGNYSSEIKK